MKLVKLNEARFSYSDELVNQIKEYPAFKAIQDALIKDTSLKAEYRDVKHTIKNLLNLYSKEENIKSNEITYEGFITWIEDNQSFEGYLTPIAMDYIHELPQETVINLSCIDPDFERTINTIIKEYNWDEDEYYVSDVDLDTPKTRKRNKSTLRDLYYTLFNTWKLDKEDQVTDKDIENEKGMYEQTKDEIAKTYYAGHYVSEDLDNPIETEPVIQDVVETPEVIETEVTNEQLKSGLDQSVNYLITQAWNFISEVNSVIATLDFNEGTFENGESFKNILNTVVDDSTITIGMLHKALSLIKAGTDNLISAGEEKAENII